MSVPVVHCSPPDQRRPSRPAARLKTFRRLVTSYRVSAVCLFALALIPPLVLVAASGFPEPRSDARRYLGYASTIANYQCFGPAANTPVCLDEPLYPLLLAAFVAIGGGHPQIALYAQMLLLATACAMVLATAWKQAGPLAGWLAGLTCATFLPLIKLSTHYMTETLAFTLLAAGTLAADRLLASKSARHRTGWALTTGALFALQALTRVAGFPLITVVLAFCAAALRHQPKQAVRTCGAMLLAFCVVYSPWVVRNVLTLNRFVLLVEKDEHARHVAYYQSRYIERGLSLHDARSRAFAIRDRERKEHISLLPRHDTATRFRIHLIHTWQRLRIMLNVHPCLERPFPFAGQTLEVPPPLQWCNSLWSVTVLTAAVAMLVTAVFRGDLRLLCTLAMPAALIAVYSCIHTIPRYQTVPYAALTVPAGIGFARLFGRIL